MDVFHPLGPATLDEAVEAIERPEDCDAPCWRHTKDGGPCTCDDETEGGTWQPGC